MSEVMLTTREVAALFRVTQRSVNRWARLELLPSWRTPGGRLRFRAEDVQRFLERVDMQVNTYAEEK